MTDPLDSLFTPVTSTEPDPEFRARLMAGVRTALIDGTLEAQPVLDGAALDAPTLEVVTTTARPPRLHRARITAIVSAAALVITAVIVIAFGRDQDADPDAPVATQPQSASSTSTTVALTDDDLAIAALLESSDVGGGYVAQVGETFLSYYQLGVDLPECASFVDTVFTPLASATTRTRSFVKKLDAQFEQMAIVFSTVDAAATMMDSLAEPSYPACDTAVANAAVNANSCCEQASFGTAEPLAIEPAGDQQWVNAQTGTYVAGGTKRSTGNLISFTRVGRVVIVFGVPLGLDGNPADPDANPVRLIAAGIARLRSMPTG